MPIVTISPESNWLIPVGEYRHLPDTIIVVTQNTVEKIVSGNSVWLWISPEVKIEVKGLVNIELAAIEIGALARTIEGR